MKCRLLAEQRAGRSYAAVFDIGDDVLEQMHGFLIDEGIAAARFYGIGGFARATLGYYDMQAKRYLPFDVAEQVEVLSFIGNAATYNEKPRLHVHCVVGHRDGHTTGGHLLAGVVSPTLEVMVDEIAAGLQRTDRPEIGIPLLAP
jgi:uncharacterized protein